jgi:D-alanyl-D-alanine dipeptidase
MNLVLIAPAIPDAIVDLRYATINNIVGRQLYEDSVAKLDAAVLDRLTIAAERLRQQDLRLVIWDAYRPLEVQRQLQAIDKDPRYVSDNSMHCRGLAVDATLASSEGRYLDMGTDFDELTERAHVDTSAINDEQRKNRLLLQNVMEAAGFTQWPYEWWHYDLRAPS